MGQTNKIELSLLEEASGWLLQLEENPDDSAIRRSHEAWLSESTLHRTAWEQVTRTWTMFDAVQPAPGAKLWGDLPPPAAPRRAGGARMPAPRPAHRAASRKRIYRRTAAALVGVAAVFLAIMIAPTLIIALQSDHRTAAGRIERITMDDGSIVDLGGQSAMAADIDADHRHVRLLAGEAFFDVVRDPRRPFVVDARGVEVRVLGTEFDVLVTSETTTVALLSGSVEAVPATGDQGTIELMPGQKAVIDHVTGESRIEAVSPEDIGAWRDGMVFLSGVTLAEAAEIIQRYHTAWITIPDNAFARRRVSGLIDLRDPDRALAGLVAPLGGRIRAISPYARIIHAP